MNTFKGFTQDTFGFLRALSMNNDRSWFESHRKDYEELILTPALELITAMDPLISAISPHYHGEAKKTGGSLMRIYRDTRFSKDKTPYKTNIGIQFRHNLGKDVHAPGFYIHLSVEECFMGSGTWHPEPTALEKIRRSIADKPKEYSNAIEKTTDNGDLHVTGDSLKKVPRGFPSDHPLAQELKRVDFLVSADLSMDFFLRPDCPQNLGKLFKSSGPYMAWLCKALEIPF